MSTQIKDGLEIERRFLLPEVPDLAGMQCESSRIEQIYLSAPDARPHETHRLRKREQGGSVTCYYTVKSPGPGAARNEKESEIDAAEYERLSQYRSPDRRPIAKTRHAIPYENHTLELDVFERELQGLVILEVEISSFDAPLALPPWAKSGVEITEDFWFSNFNLSSVPPEEVRRRVDEVLA